VGEKNESVRVGRKREERGPGRGKGKMGRPGGKRRGKRKEAGPA